MSKLKIAVPSSMPGGLDAQLSAHFGHCEVFTLVEVEDGSITGASRLPNVEHHEGGCLVPVRLLADAGVEVLIAGGMGMRPLLGFMDAGIEVWRGSSETVRKAVESYLDGSLEALDERYVCGGH